MNKPHSSAAHQRGGILLISAAALTMLLGFAALAIDLGRLMVVRNELQNGADAAAMAAVPCLYRRAECLNTSATTPDWDTATSRALSFISKNKSEDVNLSTATVTAGYWNMNGTPATLQAKTITPGPYDYPAIQVQVRRTNGQNGGSVVLSLANIIGIPAGSVWVTSTAVISHPAALSPFPLVLSKCLYDTYWDSNTGSPKLATQVNEPGFDLPQVPGQPFFFKATSSYHIGACEAGQWSSLLLDSNSANTIADLITAGSPISIAIGDLLWVQTGSKNSLYGVVNNCSAAGNKNCEYAMVPIVQNLSTHSHEPVLAFACVHVLAGLGGSDKYVLFQMSADSVKCQNSGSGVGPNYGINTPPRLVQ